MKFCAAPVLPSMRIDESVVALSLNSEIREKEKFKKVGRELAGQKLWSNLPMANFLNKLGESLISCSSGSKGTLMFVFEHPKIPFSSEVKSNTKRQDLSLTLIGQGQSRFLVDI